MSEGFLERWSKRKLDVKEGKPQEAEPLPAPPPQPEEIPLPPPLGEDRGGGSADLPPPLTLDDVEALTQESDFTKFAARDVAPDVKNAAMKKLFADPRYNVMDGMDVYVDDYSKPDPMPYAMLRKLASARFLGLFEQEERDEAAAAQAAVRARDVADNPSAETVAQSDSAPQAVPEPTPHADPDLRLQQDDAAPGENPGRGIG